jgi:hypothetical protein
MDAAIAGARAMDRQQQKRPPREERPSWMDHRLPTNDYRLPTNDYRPPVFRMPSVMMPTRSTPAPFAASSTSTID